MNADDFLTLDNRKQNKLLLQMAENVLSILSGYPSIQEVAQNSTSLIGRYFNGEKLSPNVISEYLNHEDLDLDLGMQVYNVGNNSNAISAIDIVCYATGAISRFAYEEMGISKQMSDPVQESTPEVVVEALNQYQILLKHGLVSEIVN